MLLVRTFVAPSPIHGLGLFAAEPIKAGQSVWRFDVVVDGIVLPDELEELPEHTQDFVRTYGYHETEVGGWLLPGDHARFLNHSATANLQTGPGLAHVVARRDIAVGEELTEDYAEYIEDRRHLAYTHLQ